MGAIATTRVFAAAALWRVGVTGAGRSIVEAVATGDEDTATAAGMLLTRAGDRSVPLVAEAIDAGASNPVLVDVLAGIGSEAALDQLRHIEATGSGEIASEAAAAARRVEERRRR